MNRLKKLRKRIIEANIASEGEKEFDACLIFLYMLTTGIKEDWSIAHRTGIPLGTVKEIKSNWIESPIWDDKEKQFNVNYPGDGFNQKVELALISLAGAGKVTRI